MLDTTLTPASSQAAAGQLAFRVCGSARDGQILRLHSAKCTVGGGSRCTLRLRARGVAPLHCLIVRGPQATIVRRWSADTRLNGQAFTDAPLHPGDRLSIGPIDLEVLDAAAADHGDTPAPWTESADAWQSWQAQREESQRQLDQWSRQLAALQAELDARQKTLDEEGVQLADRQRGLEQSRSRLETQQQTLEEDRRRWETQQNEVASRTAVQLQQYAARHAELEAGRRGLDESRQQWQAEREASQRELDGRAGKLAVLQAELETGRRALDDSRQQWQAEREASQRTLDERAGQLDALQAELETRQKALHDGHRQGQAEQQEAVSRVAERERQLAVRKAELAAQQRALTERRQQWEAEQAQSQGQLQKQAEQLRALQVQREEHQKALDQRRRQEEEHKAAEERLRQEADRKAAEERLHQEEERKAAEERLRQEHARPAETRPAAAEAVTGAERVQEPAARPSSPVAAAKSPPQHHGEEESIDDYMAQLLERLRTGSSGGQVPARRTEVVVPAPAAEPARPVVEKPNEAKAELSASVPTPLERPAETAVASPRTVAPETHGSLAAMRELANLSAQSAISRHFRRQIVRSTRVKLLIVFQGLTAGGMLLWLWGCPGAGVLTLCGAVASFVTAVVWGVEYAVLTGHLGWSGFEPDKSGGGAAPRPSAEKPTSAADFKSRGQP